MAAQAQEQTMKTTKDFSARINALQAELNQLRQDVLADYNSQNNSAAELIRFTVASFYGLTVTEICQPTRARRIAWPRMVAMALTRERTEMSLLDIASVYGRGHHGTALNAAKEVEKICAGNTGERADVDKIRGLLGKVNDPSSGA
jgi:chromosomal replication initiator protein